MNIHELLQYELWSKTRTRKILTVTGFATVVLVLLFAVWHEVERHWLTQGERNAARTALVEIDLLQNAARMNGKEFDLQEQKAQLKFDAARNLTRTYRDKEIVAGLSLYLILTTSPWDSARFVLEHPGSSIDGDPKSVLTDWNSSSDLRKQLHSSLHRALD